MSSLKDICSGLPLDPLPRRQQRDNAVPHAPIRNPNLTPEEELLALQNALRYFPSSTHEVLAPEFAEELREYGHIYMYRFRPNVDMRAYPVSDYPAVSRQAASVMHMIMNNLDPRVAQFPHELVTYGGNGQVFSNWAQFLLTMHYLSIMNEEQTLVMYSGHPMGLFPSSRDAPRVVITNGMVIPNYSSREQYEKMFALGVTMYGQMTAGSYCYIGPQGIVHGTTITVMNAGRKYLKEEDLSGKVFLTSGLGGMSGAQPKAAVINGCVGVIAEVSKEALEKRFNQGWLKEKTSNLDELFSMIRNARQERRITSIGYLGNIVDVWERAADILAKTGERLIDLGSDQTSLHNPFNGGYYPAQCTFDEANLLMKSDPDTFKKLVQESLRRQVAAIDKMTSAGMAFWDYGNAFLLEASRAGADVVKAGAARGIFKYPSYVQDIMGDIFSMGFGPFRWVCTSGSPLDLAETDRIAAETMEAILNKGDLSVESQEQYRDNIKWIKAAQDHGLVVGSQARILYTDAKGRASIAVAFNKAMKDGRIKSPIVLSRDHHDVSGTDSPFRETSNIYDGSSFCADMAIQNCIGDSFRGATWVAIHNGGGCGWGEVMNGGFGLVLDGTQDAERKARLMLSWDVNNGVARRAWCGNSFAQSTISRAMKDDEKLKVTVPYQIEDINALAKAFKELRKADEN